MSDAQGFRPGDAGAEDANESAGKERSAPFIDIINATAPEQQRSDDYGPADVDLSGGAEPDSGLNDVITDAGPLGWTPASADPAAAGGGGDMVFTRHRRGTFACVLRCLSAAHKQHEHVFVAAPSICPSAFPSLALP